MTTFRQALTSGGFFILFCLLLAAAVLGVKVPSPTPVVSVGTMQIAPFADGLSLYQSFRGLYYPISPFNDYVITQDGRTSFITKDQIDAKEYSSSLSTNPLITIPQVISSYLWQQSPAVTFKVDGETISYSSVIHNNQLDITSTFTDLIPPDPKKMGVTLAYHSDDIVFDRSQKVYSYWDSPDLVNMQKTYGIKLTPSQNALRIPIKDNKVFIINPAVSGVIEVRADTHQQLIVNRDAKLIEVLQPVTKQNNTYVTTLYIQILNNPKEALE